MCSRSPMGNSICAMIAVINMQTKASQFCYSIYNNQINLLDKLAKSMDNLLHHNPKLPNALSKCLCLYLYQVFKNRHLPGNLCQEKTISSCIGKKSFVSRRKLLLSGHWCAQTINMGGYTSTNVCLVCWFVLWTYWKSWSYHSEMYKLGKRWHKIFTTNFKNLIATILLKPISTWF